ncbi:MAG: DNA-processing protein DprA [Bacillus sp. (in: firmicutes)]
MNEFDFRLILLHHCRGIGWSSIESILKQDPVLKDVYRKSEQDWKHILPSIPSKNLSLFYRDLHSINLSYHLSNYRKNNIHPLTISDNLYPYRLKQIHQPPWVLYCKGEMRLLGQYKMLAVVGSRKPTEYGRQVIKMLLPPLLESGYVIVSGLAAGIDRMSHEAALLYQGRTIGVLGGGVLQIYPKENTGIAQKMMEEQLVISETVPVRRAEPWMFPMRNRIISGLCDGVLIIEAKERSGTLITAYQALEQGRDVFAVPGDITGTNSDGTNRLIQEGAKLVRTAMDIGEELNPILPL